MNSWTLKQLDVKSPTSSKVTGAQILLSHLFEVLNFQILKVLHRNFSFYFTLILAIFFRFNSHKMPATSFKTIQLDLWSHYSNLTFIYIVIQDRNIDMQKL